MEKVVRDIAVIGNGRGKVLKVTKNLRSNLVGLNAPQANLIINIADGVLYMLQFNNTYKPGPMTEIKLAIPYHNIGRKNDYQELYQSALALMDRKIQYVRAIPGYECTVVATLISSVIKTPGKLLVTIPEAALPFYLFCGKTVGYSKLERDVVLNFHSVTHKMLYLLMAEKIDANTEVGTCRLMIEDIHRELGLLACRNSTYIRRKVLEAFKLTLEQSQSAYRFSYTPITEKTGRKGQPRVCGFSMTMKISDNSIVQKEKDAVFMYLRSHFQYIRDPRATYDSVFDELMAQGAISDFCSRMSRIVTTNKSLGKENILKVTNYMRTILRDEYNIEI